MSHIVHGGRFFRGGYWMSCQLTAGPLLMADVRPRGPTAHQERFWGSVSCSRTPRHVAQCHPRGARIQTSDLPITSPPALPTELQQPLKNIYEHEQYCSCVWSGSHAIKICLDYRHSNPRYIMHASGGRPACETVLCHL